METYKRNLNKDKEILEGRYKNLYGKGNYKEKIKANEKDLKKKLLLIAIIFLLITLYNIVEKNKTEKQIYKNSGKMIYIERPEKGESSLIIDSRILAFSKKGQYEKSKEIIVEPKGKKSSSEENVIRTESEGERLDRKITSLIRSLNYDVTKEKVILPTTLEDGTKLIWEKENSGNAPILIGGVIFLLFITYKSRFNKIKKEEKEARESIIKELPEFINKIVLLLGAGIVFNVAFNKIMEDYGKIREEKPTYFYSQLLQIYVDVKETNASLHIELRTFGKRSGVRELMRLSNIITDNISKGTDLVEKLKSESDLLWFARKKQSEEKGRLTETKLTAPLVILLLVLVIVTISPALLEM